MGKMNIVLDDELETKFRETVFKRKGMKKGNISEALEEAIKQWMEFYHPEQGKKQNAKQR
jgi:hypothetical protein